jgi:hypothetical protein
MKSSYRFILCALALLVPGGLIVWAADPPTTGHVLVLDNGRALEGDVERVGDQYRLRRSIGETWLPADKVQALCNTIEDAYQFLRGQANLRDPDERLRLARWCQQHGLRTQALAEISAGLELRPNHVESRRLWQNLQRTEAAVPPPAKPKEENETELPVVEYNTDALGTFVTRVQPILMNTCISCHCGNRGGSFKLIRNYEDALTSRRATQQNLAAVLGQVNRDRPQQSLLLARAVAIHGDAEQAPLKNKQTPAYRILEEWVQLATANGGAHVNAAPVSLPEPAPESRGFAEMLQPKPTPAAPTATAPAPPAPPPSAPATPTPPAAPPAAPAVTAPPSAPPESTPTSGADDPFDPAIFNKQMHPEKP